MRNSTYSALFRTIAGRNKLIRHQEAAPRFARIIVSVDPLQRQVDLLEMQEVLLSRKSSGAFKVDFGEQVLVLESLQTQYRDNAGDNYQRTSRGAFFLLEQKTKDGDAWELLDRTEENGEQVLAAARKEYEDRVKVRWPVGSIVGDAVGPIGDNWYGTRFDFEIISPANAGLTYNSAAFS